jgi:hypothetical protein
MARNRTPRPPAPAPTRRVQTPAAERVVCPRCGRFDARIIGRSESVPVVYLRCDGCHLASVAGA